MRLVSAYASQVHYADHVAPIFEALPESLRGEFWSPSGRKSWGAPLPHPRRRPPGPVLVAGFADHQRMAPAPTILVEHGSGQSYSGSDSGSYSGGAGLERVAMFLCPSERVAQRWRDRYPDASAVAVGCPRLDPLHAGSSKREERAETGSRPVVAVTAHWPCNLNPETQSALPHYRNALGPLRDAVAAVGGLLVGHAHPRAARAMRRLWADLGVPYEPDLDEVLRQADVLVCDNSSAMWEAASCGIRLVILDAPWFRPEVDHGQRFWAHADAGVRIQEPDQLVDAVFEALGDPPGVRARRAAAVADIYVACDGRAAERAVDAIVRLVVAGS